MSKEIDFHFNEKYLSQIPALQVLINLGYRYINPIENLAERQGKKANVLLENILREQLKKINRIHHKGTDYLFSEANIQTALLSLKNVKYDGLLQANQAVYDLLTLGVSLEQSIEGDLRSYNLHYIDWRHPENNVYHVTAECETERNHSLATARPDIVLYVNGIPFAVIECKAPSEEVDQAVSQSIRNQGEDYIPKLFTYTQLVMGVNKNKALYGTVRTAKKFWALWKELVIEPCEVEAVVAKPLPESTKKALFTGDFTHARKHFDELESQGPRLVTEQDTALVSLCRPDRLVELAFKYVVFDNGEKKIARYQQYFVVKAAMQRLKHIGADGCREGGVIWHTQGSGKTLSMVMLARELMLDPDLSQPRIVLVTDREDLDIQIKNTFKACGREPQRATSGRHLLELVADKQSAIVTTLVHKFDKALKARQYKNDSTEIFMLVDESHRTHFGPLAARMRLMFPKACYLGFTGTPLIKKEKNSFEKFGGLIRPHYSIQQAVEDKAVVPLLYEGRLVEMEQNKAAIDLWFERHTQGLSDKQKADLKRKYARAEMLNKAEQVIYMRAFDISEHYRASWQGTGFKAQLVAPDKGSALLYHRFLNEIGHVDSEVVISAPDEREGYEETDDESTDEVVKFWKRMMARYGGESEYNKQIINQFKVGHKPEILIVVSKLLTGFDAPCNTVLYLCRVLRSHTLLQAIARVNRLHENKEFGYIIDYVSVLGELDKALTMYKEFEEYDAEDLVGTLVSVNEEIAKLPQRHSDLLSVFKTIKNKADEEAFEQHLGDEEIRHDFYESLTEYAKNLQIALSASRFLMETPEAKLNQYREDLKRYEKLRVAVKLRYAEGVDYRDYEPKIRKLLDTHIQASEVTSLNEPVNIFNEQSFVALKETMGHFGSKRDGAIADAIAHATKKVITEKMEEDPAFYERFSKLIQQAIDDFRAKRLSESEYLKKVGAYQGSVLSKKHDDLPAKLKGQEDATAFYGVFLPFFESDGGQEGAGEDAAADMALAVVDIFQRNKKVQFWEDEDAKKKTVNEIDDFIYDVLKGKAGLRISNEQMDGLIEAAMRVGYGRWGK